MIYLKQLGVRGWRRKSREREEWAKIFKEVKTLQGL
jgi:hypothetical protein